MPLTRKRRLAVGQEAPPAFSLQRRLPRVETFKPVGPLDASSHFPNCPLHGRLHPRAYSTVSTYLLLVLYIVLTEHPLPATTGSTCNR